jgi:hypothetical protein
MTTYGNVAKEPPPMAAPVISATHNERLSPPYINHLDSPKILFTLRDLIPSQRLKGFSRAAGKYT